jgi:hypothetical protein
MGTQLNDWVTKESAVAIFKIKASSLPDGTLAAAHYEEAVRLG